MELYLHSGMFTEHSGRCLRLRTRSHLMELYLQFGYGDDAALPASDFWLGRGHRRAEPARHE